MPTGICFKQLVTLAVSLRILHGSVKEFSHGLHYMNYTNYPWLSYLLSICVKKKTNELPAHINTEL
jgi:hypothetical protein